MYTGRLMATMVAGAPGKVAGARRADGIDGSLLPAAFFAYTLIIYGAP